MFDYIEYESPNLDASRPKKFMLRRLYELEAFCPVCFNTVDTTTHVVITCRQCFIRVHLRCCLGMPLPNTHIGMRCKATD